MTPANFAPPLTDSGHGVKMLPVTGRICRNLGAVIGTVVLASLAACSSKASTTGPPTAAVVASELNCHVSDYFSGGEWAYDTANGANLGGGPCSNSGKGLFIITFPSRAKETNWLHRNAAVEHSRNFPDGYFELVVGHLWIIGDPSGAAVNLSFVIAALGGRVTTF